MFGKYLAAQCKRIFKICPAVLTVTVILACCLGLLGAVILQTGANQERRQKVRIGLVGSTEGSYLGFGIQALRNLDSSRFTIDFVEVSSGEAAGKAMERGELSAYVLIPDGFVDALARGDNMSVTYVTSAGAAGIGSMVMNELVETISRFITESQNGIYGAQSFLRQEGRTDIYWEASDRLYLRYLDLILGREMIYDLEVTGVSGGLTAAEYCVCAIMILFLMLWGIAAAPALTRQSTAVSKLLSARGLSSAGQILAEYFAYAALLLGSFLVFVILTSIGATFWGDAVLFTDVGEQVRALSAVGRIGRFLGMIPVVMMFGAMQLCIYEWVPNPVTGVLLQFLGALGLGYLSGCFYPIDFFPAGIQLLAPLLPTGAAMSYSGKLLSGKAAPGELAVMGLYAAGCFLAAVLSRKRKLNN